MPSHLKSHILTDSCQGFAVNFVTSMNRFGYFSPSSLNFRLPRPKYAQTKLPL